LLYLPGQYFFLTTAPGTFLVRRMEPRGITAGSAMRVRRADDQPGNVHVMAAGKNVNIWDVSDIIRALVRMQVTSP
jgi:hypothetical protein